VDPSLPHSPQNFPETTFPKLGQSGFLQSFGWGRLSLPCVPQIGQNLPDIFLLELSQTGFRQNN